MRTVPDISFLFLKRRRWSSLEAKKAFFPYDIYVLRHCTFYLRLSLNCFDVLWHFHVTQEFIFPPQCRVENLFPDCVTERFLQAIIIISYHVSSITILSLKLICQSEYRYNNTALEKCLPRDLWLRALNITDSKSEKLRSFITGEGLFGNSCFLTF